MKALAVLLAGYLAILGVAIFGTPGPSARCSTSNTLAAAASVDASQLPAAIGPWKRDQLAIAATVINVAAQRGLDRWTQQLGVAVAMKESSLTNLDHGDAVRNDTIGVFQIGPEHGPYASRMDPAWSAGNFFDRLLAVPNYHQLAPSLAAHKAQRNADPDAYTSLWDDADAVVTGLTRTSAGSTAPVSTSTSTTPKSYQLGPVQPVAQRVADTLGPMFGIKTIGGWRPGSAEKYDQQGHPAGLALDLMIDDIPNGKAVGDRLADYLIANADKIGVRYIIWQQRSWTPLRNAWRPMADRGSPTANHMDHVHLSLKPDATGTITSTAALGGCENAPAGGSSVPVGPEGWAQPISTAPGGRTFGMRMHPIYHVMKMHEGQDFGAACGTPIYAASAGTVTFAGQRGGYGHLIIIDHGQAANGAAITTRYGHMYANGLHVSVGQQVTAGQQIADVGSDGTSTACHLHFEVRVDATPVDPVEFLLARGVSWATPT